MTKKIRLVNDRLLDEESGLWTSHGDYMCSVFLNPEDEKPIHISSNYEGDWGGFREGWAARGKFENGIIPYETEENIRKYNGK